MAHNANVANRGNEIEVKVTVYLKRLIWQPYYPVSAGLVYVVGGVFLGFQEQTIRRSEKYNSVACLAVVCREARQVGTLGRAYVAHDNLPRRLLGNAGNSVFLAFEKFGQLPASRRHYGNKRAVGKLYVVIFYFGKGVAHGCAGTGDVGSAGGIGKSEAGTGALAFVVYVVDKRVGVAC